MSGPWERGGVGVKREMPVLLLSFPLPFLWRPEQTLVMEGVSVECGLPFKTGLGGKGESMWNLEKGSELL